jgi:hypothetical protein
MGLPVFVEKIVVTPGKLSVVRQEQSSPRTLDDRDALLVPSMGGDVSRVLGMLPGVTAPDSSAALIAAARRATSLSSSTVSSSTSRRICRASRARSA